MTSEKSILQNNFEGKKLARIYLGKIMSCTEKNIAQDVYNAEKKILLRYMSGEKFVVPEVWEKILTQTKSPIPRSSTKVKLQGWARSGRRLLTSLLHLA